MEERRFLMVNSTREDQWANQEEDERTWFRGTHYRTRTEETRLGMEVPFEGGQYSERAVAPNVDRKKFVSNVCNFGKRYCNNCSRYRSGIKEFRA
jgi:hypothetical protein